MIFLIEYDRAKGVIVSLRGFADSERVTAENARLELELGLNHRKLFHEVVLLEAPTEDDLRRTHRRYFDDLAHIVGSSSGSS